MISRWARGAWGKLAYGLLTGVAVFCFVYFLPRVSETTQIFLNRLERGILDQFFQLREPDRGEVNPYVSDRIRLVAFDEDSMAVIGKWPWKRYVHAGYLQKLERFRPRSVLLDLILVDEERAPDYLLEAGDFQDSTKQELVDMFYRMDLEMAAVLSVHSNIYLDVQLMGRPREGLPEEYAQRILLNEQALAAFALSVEGEPGGLEFNSIEPVLSEFIVRAKPALINVPNDIDNRVRRWPLFYKYHSMSQGIMYLPSSVVLLLCDLYYSDYSNIRLDSSGTVAIDDCSVPELDPVSRNTVIRTVDFDEFENRLESAAIPFNYTFDNDLRRFLVNSHIVGPSSPDRIPHFPLPVLDRDGKYQILGRWEIFSAARALGAKKINIILHKSQTVELPTVRTEQPVVQEGCFYINFNGTEGNYYEDPVTGLPKVFSRFPANSYQDVYTMDPLPPMPTLDDDGRIVTNGYDMTALELWFFRYCGMRAEKTELEADMILGEDSVDPEKLLSFLHAHPEQRRFFLYREFLIRKEAATGMLWGLFEDYPAFGKQMGQNEKYFLSEEQLVQALLECYGLNYDRFYDQIIFTGGNTVAIGDVHQTPYGPMFGIQVIMNALSTLVTDNMLIATSNIHNLDMLLLLVLCAAGGVGYSFIGARYMWILFLLSTFGLFAGTRISFEKMNTIVSLAPLLFGNSFTFLGVMGWKIMTEEKDKRFLQKTFGAYLAPEVISDMYKKQAQPKLGGETRHVTAYFTDIEGFSHFSEKLAPGHLLELLNVYLTEMTSILTEEKGTLDKYIGDAIVAFYGAPGDVPDHPLRACLTALRMQDSLNKLRRRWADEMLPAAFESRNIKNLPASEWAPGHKWPNIVHGIKMRIGVNTGHIVVGNMGSKLRMNYTMMGDAVNLAARLEAACKHYGLHTLLSESALKDRFTYKDGRRGQASDLIASRYIDRVVVVGKTEPVTVFEPIALKSDITGRQKTLIETFQRAIAHYMAMEWGQAIDLFSEALTLEPNADAKINPSSVFINRCRDLQASPPGLKDGKWDGIYRLTKK